MSRAGFKCECCGDSDQTLNIHHKAYKRGIQPWEYEDSMLVCCCESCHAEIDEYFTTLLATIRPDDLLNALDLAQQIHSAYSHGLGLDSCVNAIREMLADADSEMVKAVVESRGVQTS